MPEKSGHSVTLSVGDYADFKNMKLDQPGRISHLLAKIGIFCEIQAMKDENWVIEAYHDQWMAARIEILRCAEVIRKGGE